MSLGWDEELPAGFQDADIEMREFEAQAQEFYGEDIFAEEPSGRYSREELDASFGESRFDV